MSRSIVKLASFWAAAVHVGFRFSAHAKAQNSFKGGRSPHRSLRLYVARLRAKN